MADQVGQQDIRGLNVEALAKGFADEDLILRQYVNVVSTTARENRWFQKTSGFVDTTDTTGITGSRILSAPLARPSIVQQSWTRNTSYVKKWIAESEWISEEDIKDATIDVIATMVRDVTRAVGYQEESHIWDILTESRSVVNINSVTTTSVGGDQWDAASGQNPLKDIMRGIRLIRGNSYDTTGGVLMLSPTDHESLLVYLISTVGSSFPNFSSERVRDGVVMSLLGLKVVVSTVVTADYALIFVPQRACTLYEFMPITATTISEPGIGRKIRCWVESVAVLTDPKACTLIIDTQT